MHVGNHCVKAVMQCIGNAKLDEAFFMEAKWLPPFKQPVTIRLDADVLEWFRSQGPGYQTRINRLLRRYMEVSQQRN